MCQNEVDFRLGDEHSRVVLLGACPGQEEFKQNRPFAGATGANLDRMLEELYVLQGQHFPSSTRDDYTLMNAYGKPLWKGKDNDNRTIPTLTMVSDDSNIDRLARQLRYCEARTVLGLGTNKNNDSAARRAIRRLQPSFPSITWFICGHPSPRAINRYAGGDAVEWLRHTFEEI
ncbi:uracil-DNA glycosylase family protein [Falsihalocynthiibacter sp. CO-5D18]|uniref:uracil-DNA glycosylase family protein n=1 Tax=Falsihalocynthiibacter sp. CO-5D18 TaxID=3240872 RepID=UPI00350F531B